MNEIDNTSPIFLAKSSETTNLFVKKPDSDKKTEKAAKAKDKKTESTDKTKEQKFIPVFKSSKPPDKAEKKDFATIPEKDKSFIDKIRERNLKPAGQETSILKNRANNIATNTRITEKIANLTAKLSIEKGSFTNLKFSDLFPNTKNLPDGEDIGSKILEVGTSAFLQKNKELVTLFNGNTDLLSKLASPNVENQEDVKGLIVDFVQGKIDSSKTVTRDFLSNNFTLTKFAAFNLGGIIDVLNNDNSAQKAFTADETFGLEILEDKIADKAASKFQKSAALSPSFFSQNPLAAFRFLSSSSARSSATTEKSNKKSDSDEEKNVKEDVKTDKSTFDKKLQKRNNDEIFASQFSRQEEDLKSEAVNFAFNQLQRGSVFTKDFLNNNSRFSNVIANDKLTNKKDSLVDFLDKNKGLTKVSDKPVNLEKIYTSFQAESATKKLPKDFPIDKEFLDENFNVAFLINQSPKFTNGLIRDKERVEKFIDLSTNKTKEIKTTKNEAFTKVNGAINSFFDAFNPAVEEIKTGRNVDLTA